MAEGAAAAAIVGTGIQVYAQLEEAKAQEKAAKAQAEAKRLEAFEMLARSEQNILATMIEGAQVSADQQITYAASGVGLGSGTTLSMLEETYANINKSISMQRKEAAYKAEALFRGADIDTQLAGDIKKAGRLQAVATFLTGASKTYSATK